MEDLSMSKETFAEIIKGYDTFIWDAGDVERAFWLVADLLEAERDAIKEKEPYATRAINELDEARRTVFMMTGYFTDAYDEVFCNGEK